MSAMVDAWREIRRAGRRPIFSGFFMKRSGNQEHMNLNRFISPYGEHRRR